MGCQRSDSQFTAHAWQTVQFVSRESSKGIIIFLKVCADNYHVVQTRFSTCVSPDTPELPFACSQVKHTIPSPVSAGLNVSLSFNLHADAKKRRGRQIWHINGSPLAWSQGLTPYASTTVDIAQIKYSPYCSAFPLCVKARDYTWAKVSCFDLKLWGCQGLCRKSLTEVFLHLLSQKKNFPSVHLIRSAVKIVCTPWIYFEVNRGLWIWKGDLFCCSILNPFPLLYWFTVQK